MARLLLLAASAALLASTAFAADAAVLVVRSSGPSAGTYPPGKALPDSHILKLKPSDTIVLLDSRGTRTLSGPGNFSVSASAGAASGAVRTAGTSARRVRLGAVRGAGARSVWQADLGRSGNVCVANPGELTLYRPDAAGPADITLTDSDGKSAKVHFEANQWEASWPTELEVKTGKRVNVSGLAAPATLTLRQLTPIPSGLEGMAQSLIRADCQAQLDVLINTFSARTEG
jgi:opacity protein-like surface antigen